MHADVAAPKVRVTPVAPARSDGSRAGTLDTLRSTIRALTYCEEREALQRALQRLDLPEAARVRIVEQARAFVRRARERKAERGLLEQFLQEFGLSNQEGIALLCLAEALHRVPDAKTADNLIAEKIRLGQWERHKGQSDSVLVNAATRALMLTSDIVQLDPEMSGQPGGWLSSLVNRLGEPVVRTAVSRAVAIMGDEFVLGRTIEEALDRARQNFRPHEVASFDMLGEGARTEADAQRHFDSYVHAIRMTAAASREGLFAGHGVSVKLSALHPRYEYAQRERVLWELLPRVKALALEARAGNIHMTIDAEEANRLDLSLDIIEALARDRDLEDWQGLGLALQCYSKRATAVLDWIIALGQDCGRRFLVRLVKGAYWDSEIKRAQEQGLGNYPVFTRKVNTDCSYLACARRALAHSEVVYPQFATHNAHTIAAVLDMAAGRRDFEFQRLHGMGELLYATVRDLVPDFPQVRVYAPVGTHKDLLAYLVRRLLENGANTSFVNRFMDESVPLDALVTDPIAKAMALEGAPHAKIPLPALLYGAERRNSAGVDLSNPAEVEPLLVAFERLRGTVWESGPIVNGRLATGARAPVVNPANREDIVGFVTQATPEQIHAALDGAVQAQPAWDRRGGEARAAILERAADLLEGERDRFVSLLVREAGKTFGDAIAEVREAVDFCRYYAVQARREFGAPRRLAGPTGEANLYSLHGRGVFVCISPWNFPLAIFLGQVTAALAAGNAVTAKPAEQTPLVAAEAVKLLHRSGVPLEVLHLLPGQGETVGAALVADERIAGVAMTGSTATAKIIARTLAGRRGAIIPLIAETGGQNAMFVDSTALPEQVTDDVIRSAFHSAGQRCSALRVCYVQEEIADTVIRMIRGAMDQLSVGDPSRLSTDVGPVIDEAARANLLAHVEDLAAKGRLVHAVRLGEACSRGTFVAPHLFEIEGVEALTQENFGPILHVVRYRTEDLERHLQRLEETGYGLTLGIHSRIEAAARRVFEKAPAGNVYVNRNMIGAVVGVQPFGGHGLSGTGPKAGGPLYMHRYATERVVSINTTATGGNAALLCLDDDDR